MAHPIGLWIIGFGGHARSVADVALASGFRQLLFLDDNARPGEKFLDFDVLKSAPGSLPTGWSVFPAAGESLSRERQCEQVVKNGWPLATIVAPTATLGIGCRIQPGSMIAHHAHIGPMAIIGTGSIINTGAIVEHESVVGDYSHISVHATVAGRSHLGKRVFVGAGATIIDAINICDDVTIGAGGCAVADIIASGIYTGVPARRLK